MQKRKIYREKRRGFYHDFFSLEDAVMTLDDFTVEIAGDWPCHISLPLAIAVQFNHAFDATLSLHSTEYTAPNPNRERPGS